MNEFGLSSGDESYLDNNIYKLPDGSYVKVQIYDTLGEERYRSLLEGYCRNGDACILVYDISRKDSFDEIKNYFKREIEEKCKKTMKIILLGNKSDLENEREVTSEEGALFALENNYIFMETSCLTGHNIYNAFETLIQITNEELKKNNNNKIKEKGIFITNDKKKINLCF